LKFAIVSVVVTATLASIAMVVMTSVLLRTGPEETDEQKLRAQVMTIMSVGATIWPLLWYFSIGRIVLADGSLLPLAGSVWPSIMLLVDVRGLRKKDISSSNNLVGSLQDDANSLIGTAFAFGMLMVAYYAKSHKEMYSAMLLVLFSLVICIAFVVPQPIESKDSNEAFFWASVQRTVFAYAVGYLLTALFLVIQLGAAKMGGGT